MNHINRAAVEKKFVVIDDGTSCSSLALPPMPKGFTGMKDAILKVTSPGQTFVDTCAGTYATLKSSLLLSRPCSFAGSQIDRV